MVGDREGGVMGELHPLVREHYDLPDAPLLVADLDLNLLLEAIPDEKTVYSVPVFPPVLEDLAVVVDEALPAERVRQVILQAGGKIITNVGLFDVYTGNQVGPGKKSLAYSLTYQATNRTLADKDVAGIRVRIVQRLEQELGARLRS